MSDHKRQDPLFAPRARWTFAALATYWLAIFVGTHLPSPHQVPVLPANDKLLHTVAYLILALLLAAHCAQNRSLAVADYGKILGILLLYAIVDELVQIPVGRQASIADWMADGLGAILGLLGFGLAAFRKHR